jgi:hypothetical protein
MANESLLQPSSSLSGPATASLIDDLFDLAASRNLEMMLGKILRMTIGILEAEAGSAMFQTQYLQAVRSGAFRREALDRIQHWEEAIAQRLQLPQLCFSSWAENHKRATPSIRAYGQRARPDDLINCGFRISPSSPPPNQPFL